jgi:hypothetical protein
MTIGFNAAFDPGQFRVRQQLGPAAQVKSGLRLVLREFDGQCRHGVTLRSRFGQGQVGCGAEIGRAHGKKANPRPREKCKNQMTENRVWHLVFIFVMPLV